MFSLIDRSPNHTCQGYSRREFLRVGSAALAGLPLFQFLPSVASGVLKKEYVRDKSVVLLFLQGGPTHIEFFDPKMSAPSEIRSITGEVKTKLPGVTFGGTFPKLAALADTITIVRSYGTGNAGHTYGQVVSGNNRLKASMSSIYARVQGTNHPITGIPTNVLVLPEAVQDGLKLESNFETSALPTLTQAGELGPTYAAFDPSGGGELQKNLELKITPQHLNDRRALLGALDNVRRRVDAAAINDGAGEGLSSYRRQAFEMILRGVAEAFDLSKEDAKTIERYDTTGLFRLEDLTRWYDMRRATNCLGRQMLLARRLCEAGCGFVTVSDCGWDYHANNNSPKYMTGIYPMGGQVDHAVSAFIEDVRQRGLEDRILLIVTGEMGRTPRINQNGGRDHYGELTSLLLFGGGLKMGQVVGQSDRYAAKALGSPHRPDNLLATVMQVLFDVSQMRLDQSLPRELVRVVESGEVIKPLFG